VLRQSYRAERQRAILLLDALHTYGWHLEDCPAFDDDPDADAVSPGSCTCDYSQVLASLVRSDTRRTTKNEPRAARGLTVLRRLLSALMGQRAVTERLQRDVTVLKAQHEVLFAELSERGGVTEEVRERLRAVSAAPNQHDD
jgi:hypothetical protein